MIKRLLAALLVTSRISANQEISDAAIHEKPIVVVIPSYKNKDWYQRNLDSVFLQNYHHFRVIYLDDASPDGTGELVNAYIKEKKQDARMTLIQNTQRVGALANLHKGIWMCAPHEIVATLDGDDWFHDPDVLAKLNQTYADPNVWVTYGQFVYYPEGYPGFAYPVPQDVIEENAFRERSGGITHLRTFYAGLFQKIKVEDLMYNGVFFPSAWDLALMLPIMEMAGIHSRFIPDILYTYNIDNPINDHKVDPYLQLQLDMFIRQMPRYSPLERPYEPEFID
jgi:glycosyltransferase involved in cell wall biosynthesis